MFHSAKPNDNLDLIVATNDLLEEMMNDVPTGTGELPAQIYDAEESTDKSAALRVRLS